jgi:hypothetical protein
VRVQSWERLVADGAKNAAPLCVRVDSGTDSAHLLVAEGATCPVSPRMNVEQLAGAHVPCNCSLPVEEACHGRQGVRGRDIKGRS